MTTRSPIGIVMNGVTGRMGYRQHLVRSILAIREQGGVVLADGSRRQVEPILVGRNPERLAAIAERHHIRRWTVDLDGALAEPDAAVYADFVVTSARTDAIKRAVESGKSVYTEKPLASSTLQAVELADLARSAGIKTGVVHDKLYLPGVRRLARLIRSGFFGRVLSVRGEFGYWVFEGDWRPSQRPSWNYRKEDGGGIVMDMFPHWSYVIERLFGTVRSVYACTATHIPVRVDERGEYAATADDAAYAIFETDEGVVVQINSSWAVRVHRRELVEFQVDGTNGSAIAGLFGCRIQPREASPRPVWNPDVPEEHSYLEDWIEAGSDGPEENGFKMQWEEFLRHVLEDAPYQYDFASGARGVMLAEAALASAAAGRRVEISVPERLRSSAARGTGAT
jgi:predicted dehydrogenase